jgi:formamidopyrimidine-DNA glycosylase
MPELPEVEVTRRALLPAAESARVESVVIREFRMRWPVPRDLPQQLTGQRIERLLRRGKYLLWEFGHGTLISHLGMSGAWRLWPSDAVPPPRAHDHVDIVLSRWVLRLTDPRRFGALLWHPASAGPVAEHPLLASLGMEPFDSRFGGSVLHAGTRGRAAPIKQILLAGHIVVGVGNIYASEALFRAGINPRLPARRLGRARCERLAARRAAGAGRGDPRRRQHLARLRVRGRRRGLLHARCRGVRARRCALSALRHDDPSHCPGPALDLLLPRLPALLKPHRAALAVDLHRMSVRFPVITVALTPQAL